MALKAVQQIMLGTVAKTETQTLHTLHQIKDTGYDAIELNGFMIRPSGFLVRMLTKAAGMPVGNGGKFDWKAFVEEAGLKVSSIHEDLGTIERDLSMVCEEASEFKTDTIVITGMYRYDYADEEKLKALIERLNKAGEALSREGLSLLYHNHNIECLRLPNHEMVYDRIIRETDPAHVNFEFDSYWAQDGGMNVQKTMEKLGSRLKMYHITDRGARLKKTPITPILKNDSMELSHGAMDLETYTEIALRAPVKAVILESHKNWANDSPLDSICLSSEFMNRHIR